MRKKMRNQFVSILAGLFLVITPQISLADDNDKDKNKNKAPTIGNNIKDERIGKFII